METIININFQGRVIPIEETAYNQLKQYVDSLRTYFANEESADEIINDIENRIAELLNERLKQGVSCIVAEDLNAVINSIGRLEDIEAAEGEEHKSQIMSGDLADSGAPVNGRFYRNADDKVVAGICSSIAMRVGVDPIIVRVLFFLLAGALFWVYILLWIIVPSQSIRYKTVRRLYRNPDDKYISGVCGGLAAYFHVQSWIPRLIFLLPLAIGLTSKGLHFFWLDWPHVWGPGIFVGSFGGTLFVLYVVLWIALPYASSATDKMELRGEKIDINTIKAATQARVSSGAEAPRSSTGGVVRVIAILIKAFFLFIAGVIALSLFGALTALMFAGTVALPFTDFLFDGWEQYTMAWAGLALTLGIPMLAFIVWIVRRLMGVRSRRRYMAYVFAGLWLTGITCTMIIAGMMAKSFSSRSVVDATFDIQQPSAGTLYVDVSRNRGGGYNSRHRMWMSDWDDEDAPFRYISADSLWMNTVKVTMEQSPDSFFHMYETRASRGSSVQKARELASHINFTIEQQGSLVTLPRGFTISRNDKFRNQQVLVTIEVPVGKRLQLSDDINDYDWFDIEINHRGTHYKHHRRNNYYSDRNYIMTPSGLEAVADTIKAVDTVKTDTAVHRLEI